MVEVWKLLSSNMEGDIIHGVENGAGLTDTLSLRGKVGVLTIWVLGFMLMTEVWMLVLNDLIMVVGITAVNISRFSEKLKSK
jgi:hypothetical protein